MATLIIYEAILTVPHFRLFSVRYQCLIVVACNRAFQKTNVLWKPLIRLFLKPNHKVFKVHRNYSA